MKLGELISRCVEPSIEDGPQFVLREGREEDAEPARNLLAHEHLNRGSHAVVYMKLNGYILPNGDVLRSWALLTRDESLIGLMYGIECDHSVRIAELYVERSYRRRGFGEKLLWCAQYLASRRQNPVVVSLSSGDVEGRRWIQRRDFEPARHNDGSLVQLGPGVDGLEQLCYAHPNGCGCPSVRFAR